MGFNNNNNKNYFTDNISRFGEDFLKQKNPKNLDMDAIRVFRDLAKGKIEIEKYGKYFLDDTFIDALIKKADENFALYDISYKGVSLIPNKDSYVQSVLTKHGRSSQAYKIILKYLYDVKELKNYKYLYGLVSNINQFRFDL